MKQMPIRGATALSQSMSQVAEASLWQLIHNELYKLYKHRVTWIPFTSRFFGEGEEVAQTEQKKT
jgi:hypothetical protein